jgi:hypothetical protein
MIENLRGPVPHFRDAITNLLLYFALLAAIIGLGFAFFVPGIGEGNGILAATFFGVAGYVITYLHNGMQNREAIATACYATVKSQYLSARQVIGPESLRDSLAKSLAIARREEKPSFGKVAPDPYRFLPAQPSGVQELRPATIQLLASWYVEDQELAIYWETLETQSLCDLGETRITNWYAFLGTQVWPHYETQSRETLVALAGELPRMGLLEEIREIFRASDGSPSPPQPVPEPS